MYTESAWKARDAWQRPDDLMRQLKITAGSRVADIGCHEGYMTIKLAGKVGASGRVYAVDLDQSRLKKLEEHLKARSLDNVAVVRGEEDNPHLPVAALDAVIIIDTYHEMDAHDTILKHILAALKPHGRLVLCEPIADARRKASRGDQESRHELAMAYAIADLRKAGFTIISQQDPFIDRKAVKGDVMWMIVAEKPGY